MNFFRRQVDSLVADNAKHADGKVTDSYLAARAGSARAMAALINTQISLARHTQQMDLLAADAREMLSDTPETT